MSLVERTTYVVYCDRCGDEAAESDDDDNCETIEEALAMAKDKGWSIPTEYGARAWHLCPECALESIPLAISKELL
jgi:hypothetical protein